MLLKNQPVPQTEVDSALATNRKSKSTLIAIGVLVLIVAGFLLIKYKYKK